MKLPEGLVFLCPCTGGTRGRLQGAVRSVGRSDTKQAGGSEPLSRARSAMSRSWVVNGHVAWLGWLLAAERTGMENSVPLFAISVHY